MVDRGMLHSARKALLLTNSPEAARYYQIRSQDSYESYLLLLTPRLLALATTVDLSPRSRWIQAELYCFKPTSPFPLKLPLRH